MLNNFILKRIGFNKKIAIGDCFEEKQKIYAIVSIGSIRIFPRLNQTINVEVLAQEEDTYQDLSIYEEYGEFSQTYKVADKDFGFKSEKLLKIGVFVHTDKNCFIQITGIKNIYYKAVDLVVVYEYKIIQEFLPKKLKSLIKNKKLEKFHVIENSKKLSKDK